MQSTREAPTGYEAGSLTVHLAASRQEEVQAREWLYVRLLPQVIELARLGVNAGMVRHRAEADVVIEILGELLLRSDSLEQLAKRTDLTRLLDRLVRYKAVAAYRKMRQRQRAESKPGCVAMRTDNPRNFRNGDLSNEALQFMARELLYSLVHTLRQFERSELHTVQILKLLVEGYSVVEISLVVGRGERFIHRLLEQFERQFTHAGDPPIEVF